MAEIRWRTRREVEGEYQLRPVGEEAAIQDMREVACGEHQWAYLMATRYCRVCGRVEIKEPEWTTKLQPSSE